MQIEIVPCLQDNFAYLVVCPETRQAAVVDPADAAPILEAVNRLDVSLTAILNTHHHWDHTGGNEDLQARYPELETHGGERDADRIHGVTRRVADQDELRIGNVELRALHVPGHTLGAVAYALDGAVFTGDTLFLAGCGRLFEGTAQMMYRSLNEVFASLPPGTRVFCGHEYTLNNLKFAREAEPGNEAVRARLAAVASARENGEWTTGAALSEERETNPFMRCDSAEIIERLHERFPDEDLSTPAAVLGALRSWKDSF